MRPVQRQRTIDNRTIIGGKENNCIVILSVFLQLFENAFYTLINRINGSVVLMNPLMILVKIIKLRWIHILSYDQMVSRKINNQTTRCANSIFYTTLFTNSAPNYT
ncbi:hypothetical protein IY32_25165 [Escherichia coli]|nr:hypothetical protein IY33_19720 [Escherichia coli]KIQ43766.1 hypothetical protein IY32_25165 [Escherichia coli]